MPTDNAPLTAPPVPTEGEGYRWVPVRTLTARHKPRVVEHLLGLAERDRYLRFGYVASDGQIESYVEKVDFDRDEVFGVFNRRLELVAMAHLAYLTPVDGAITSAEFGVSVSEHLRGRGIGGRLFDHSMLHARNRGIDTLFVHALSENTPMLKIARRAGARVERSGGDSDACLKLPPLDLASRLEELVEGGAAEVDYSLKRRAQQIDGLMSSLAEVSAHLVRSSKGGSE
jgi:ribosomal protein S18 acetylase RimI-like enzyme